MNYRHLTPVHWFLSLSVSVGTSASLALFLHIVGPHPGLPPTAVTVLAGAVLGFVMGFLAAEVNRRGLDVAELEDGDDLIQAARASRSGPVPTDPRIRQAALRLAVLRAGRTRWMVPIMTWAYGLLIVVYAVLAVVLSPRWLLACAVFVPLLVFHRVMKTRTDRRVNELAAANDEHDAGQAAP